MLDNLISLAKGFLGWVLSIFPDEVARRIRRILSAVVGTCFTGTAEVEGLPFGSGAVLSMKYFGTLEFVRCIFPRAFEPGKLKINEGHILISRVPRRIQAVQGDTDIVIMQSSCKREAEFEEAYLFQGQSKVQQKVDISVPWEEIRRRFHGNARDTERKIRKYGFTYHISRSLKDFENFYNCMYVPHAKRKFGALAAVDSISWQRKRFDGGFLLVLDQRDRPVAATLCSVNGDTFIYWRMGVLDSDLIALRGQSALYFFMIKMAKEKGLKWVDLRGSLPFLNDGVYAHKRKWGSIVLPDSGPESWVYYRILRNSESVIRFFELNPIIILTENGLKGLVGWAGGQEISSEEKARLIQSYYSPGLHGLLLLTRHSRTPVEVSFEERIQDPPEHQTEITDPSVQ